MPTGNSKTTKKNPFIANLISEGKNVEKQVVNSEQLNGLKEKPETQILEVITQNNEDTLPEKIEVQETTQKQNSTAAVKDIEAFLKPRKKETEVVMAVVSRAHRDELKIVSTALGINLQDLIANIFDNFLESNQVEIKKAKKKLIEGK